MGGIGMLIRCGIDIVEIKRIKELFHRNEKYIKNLFSDKELKYCLSKKNKFQHLGVRFAAKEAMIKALGESRPKEIKWSDIEVVNNNHGAPLISLKGKLKEMLKKMNTQQISVSLSHSREYAIAMVILQIGGKKVCHQL